jgi:alpha-ribazole phosphatase
MNNCTRWWWVRHAPVVGVDGVIYGANDVECDVSNTAHFESLAETLPTDAVWVTSHLTRAIKTARAIASAGLEMKDPLIEKNLGEQDFGNWQGMSWDKMFEIDKEAYNEFWTDPTGNRPPGGESFVDLIGRTRAVIERLTVKYQGRDIIAVVHGGTIRAALSATLELTPMQGMALQFDTLSISILENVEDGLLRGHGGTWRLVGANRLVGKKQ